MYKVLVSEIIEEDEEDSPDSLSSSSDDSFIERHFRINRGLFSELAEKYGNSQEYASLDHYNRIDYKLQKQLAVFLWFAGHEACSYRDPHPQNNLPSDKMYQRNEEINILNEYEPHKIENALVHLQTSFQGCVANQRGNIRFDQRRSTLEIRNPVEDDFGWYECVARGVDGKNASSIEVLGPPRTTTQIPFSEPVSTNDNLIGANLAEQFIKSFSHNSTSALQHLAPETRTVNSIEYIEFTEKKKSANLLPPLLVSANSNIIDTGVMPED
ncbi:unnamed protein product [Ceutorhynchus assimilis]|uniref:Immunoglobulin I-set domain-containing protein n=1 Tax=Ceutorhynchus assimilis TaxID=467358 RepID=A0A9N9MNN4_9CUCU|nr:unnamed protein product [Ceutorhynchus assimilis]